MQNYIAYLDLYCHQARPKTFILAVLLFRTEHTLGFS